MATKKVEVAMDGAKATVEVKEPPKKKCDFNSALPASVIALVKASPNNDTIRNLLLAHLRVSVPKEEDTFEKVKHWVEYNVEPPPRPKTAEELEEERYREERRRIQAAEEERRRTQVMLSVRASEREHGRCSYHQDVAGEGEMPIQRHKLVELASEAGSESDFFDSVEAFLDEEGAGNYVSMDVVENSGSYEDHETEDTTDSEVTLKDEAKAALKEALRNADPELYRSLFGE